MLINSSSSSPYVLVVNLKGQSCANIQNKIKMQENKYVEEAFPLITVNEGERDFHVNPRAVEFLKSVPKPIAVVGVAGLYRTGKSYLLNRVILNKGTGFGVGPTVNPCTKVSQLKTFSCFSEMNSSLSRLSILDFG